MLSEARSRAQSYGMVFQPIPPFKETRTSVERLRDYMLYGLNVFRAYGPIHALGLARKLARRWFAAGRAACYLPWEFVIVDSQGNVAPCGWWYRQPPMGNLYEQSFEEIWWGDAYALLRKELRGHLPLRQVCACCPAVASRRVDEQAFQSVNV